MTRLKDLILFIFLRRYFIYFLLILFPLIANTKKNNIINSKPSDIVNVQEIDSSILVDMMYFSSENFVGKSIDGYYTNICYLTKKAALFLQKAQAKLQEIGKKKGKHYSLFLRDCYRPQKAVNHFIRWVHDKNDSKTKSNYYPDLEKNDLLQQNYISPISGHTRASSVDVTIVEIDSTMDPKTNAKEHPTRIRELPMGSKIDFFGPKSHTTYQNLSRIEQESRNLLLEVMTPSFRNYPKEWWHFALPLENEPYPDTSFDFDIVSLPIHQKSKVDSDRNFFILPYISNPDILQSWDQNVQSPLSLVNLFQKIHLENQLPIPSIQDVSQRSTGELLSRFQDTYGALHKVIIADMNQMINQLGIDWETDITKTYIPSAAKTEAGKKLRGNGNVTRLFNKKWLASKDGQFLLSGIVLRLDRKDFDPQSCGELRFLYRLAYEVSMNGEIYASRMPFMFNMVYQIKEDGKNCQSILSWWQSLSQQHIIDFSKIQFKQIELNAQLARFPSDLERAEGRKFAGQAIYGMRIFRLQHGKFEPIKLENTPDVKAILTNPFKQKQLRDFISKHIDQIDQGVFLLPESLLTDIALSYSTEGSSRVANKPFDVLLSIKEADDIILTSKEHPSNKNVTTTSEIEKPSPFRFISSGRALLERLNTSSCMGCHQASSTAGFHFLGVDRNDFGTKPSKIQAALDGNRLQLPFSSHFSAEISRRQYYLFQVANGKMPNLFRPHPSAPKADWESGNPHFSAATTNMPCLSQKNLPTFSSWACDQNASCQILVKNKSVSFELGQCIPPEIQAGLSCRAHEIFDQTPAQAGKKEWFTYNIHSFQDQVQKEVPFYPISEGIITAEQYNCRPSRIGVPLGRVTRQCKPEEKMLTQFANHLPSEICAIVGGKGFEEMAKGYFHSQRFAEGVGRGLLDTCSPHRFCKEDYICQQIPDFLANPRFGIKSAVLQSIHQKQIGFCTPTYFVYQLRLDGHPNPR